MPGIIQTQINQDDPFESISGYEAERVQVDPQTDTVEARVQNIINRGGKDIQSEVTRSEQAANRKGLLNTSMALGAAERARIDTALPIASQDAAALLDIKRSNQAAGNRASEFTAGQTNVAAQQERAGQQNLEQTAKEAEVQAARDVRLDEFQTARDRTLDQYQTARDRILNEYEVDLQQMDSKSALELERVQAENAELLQATQSAALIHAQASQSIGAILANPDIPANQKGELVAQQVRLLENGLSVIQGMTGVDTSQLLTFGGGQPTERSASIAGPTNLNTPAQAQSWNGLNPQQQQNLVNDAQNLMTQSNPLAPEVSDNQIVALAPVYNPDTRQFFENLDFGDLQGVAF